MFAENREGFIDQLMVEIAAHRRQALRKGQVPVVRLNGTSDVAWYKVAPKLFSTFPDVQFYDYTKSPFVARDYAIPVNYHVSYSFSESLMSPTLANDCLDNGRGVVVVVDHKLSFADAVSHLMSLPAFERAQAFINGDDHDLRFLDPESAVVVLKAKGRARKDASGFVLRFPATKSNALYCAHCA